SAQMPSSRFPVSPFAMARPQTDLLEIRTIQPRFREGMGPAFAITGPSPCDSVPLSTISPEMVAFHSSITSPLQQAARAREFTTRERLQSIPARFHKITEVGADAGLSARVRSKEAATAAWARSEEHTSELQSRGQLVCRLLLEKKKR